MVDGGRHHFVERQLARMKGRQLELGWLIFLIFPFLPVDMIKNVG